uniref:Neuromedin U C-terminal domain-containing protein n=1 Tax=Periophthalmus magnuspinnatus TaxID=409849 RepID=A0A3B4ACC3_9GOBI
MRSILSQSHHRAQRGAANSHSSSAHYTHLCAMSPVTFISITTAALLILTAPPTTHTQGCGITYHKLLVHCEMQMFYLFLYQAELQGPGGIQSRGYFLYRPRNGRRSLEYE